MSLGVVLSIFVGLVYLETRKPGLETRSMDEQRAFALCRLWDDGRAALPLGHQAVRSRRAPEPLRLR
jgi:hypothetical protein